MQTTQTSADGWIDNVVYPYNGILKWSEVKSLSCVRLLLTPWTVACQAPLSMGFSRQEYWSGLPFPSPQWHIIWPQKGIEYWSMLYHEWILRTLCSCMQSCFSSVQFSHSVMSDSLRPHELQHARPPCPSPTPGVHSNSRPLSRWCHPAISSSVVPFSSCPQSLPASESFPMSQLCFSSVQFFVTLWTIAVQAPLFMRFSRQEYWRELPCPPSEDLPDPGIELTSLTSPALAGGFLTTSTTWEAPLKMC